MLLDETKDENLKAILERLKQAEDQSEAEIKKLEEQIRQVNKKHKEDTEFDMVQLQALVSKLVFDIHGIRVGDTVEYYFGWRKKQTRTYRVDRIIAEPFFRRWRDEEDVIDCNFEITGTLMKKDGTEGESKRLWIGDIKK
jgi:hypothetical protein